MLRKIDVKTSRFLEVFPWACLSESSSAYGRWFGQTLISLLTTLGILEIYRFPDSDSSLLRFGHLARGDTWPLESSGSLGLAKPILAKDSSSATPSEISDSKKPMAFSEISSELSRWEPHLPAFGIGWSQFLRLIRQIRQPSSITDRLRRCQIRDLATPNGDPRARTYRPP